jgi:hypothetical protein
MIKKNKFGGLPLYQIPFHHITKGKFVSYKSASDSPSVKVKSVQIRVNEKDQQKSDLSKMSVDSQHVDNNPESIDRSQKNMPFDIDTNNEEDTGGWSDDDLELSEIITPESSNLHSAASLKVLAEQFSLDVREKRRYQEVTNFITKRGLDVAKFEQDKEYRILSLVESGNTLNLLDWNDLMVICSYYETDNTQILRKHMEVYLQNDPSSEFMSIYHFYESANIFETYPEALVEYIVSNHKSVKSNNLLKLYYQILRRCRDSSEKSLVRYKTNLNVKGSESILNLDNRISFMEVDEKHYHTNYILNDMLYIIHSLSEGDLFKKLKDGVFAGKSFDFVHSFLHQYFFILSL